MITVENFIRHLPTTKAAICRSLREIILASTPGLQESIKWKVPFFSRFGDICYLNPRKDGVDLGFVRGYQLADRPGILESMGRKQVRTITFFSPKQAECPTVAEIVREAVLLDEYLHKKKK